jgi:hypothetical protein
VFNERRHASICGVAICPNRQQDQMVWIGAKNRKLVVKSAYHFEKGRVVKGKGGSSNRNS